MPVELSLASSSYDLSEQFLAHHPCLPIPLRGGVDRYGFSHLLADRLGLARPPRSFANWLHGWIWWDAEGSKDLMFNRKIRHKTHVVAAPAQCAPLRREGFTDIRVGGLPFAYVGQTRFQRMPNSLLVMPPHSSDADRLKSSQDEYLDYIGTIKDAFDLVAVCVFYSDFTPALEANLRGRGLHYLLGARPDDANGLQRMRAIFDAFEYVTTNTMGSHVAYAMHSGCKTSIAGPAYRYTAEDFQSLADAENAEYLERLLHYYSRQFIQARFPSLVTSSPAQAIDMTGLGSDAIGSGHLLDRESILDALSWRTLPQIVGYLDAGRHRIRNAIRRQPGSALS